MSDKSSVKAILPKCLLVDDLPENLLALESLLRDENIETVSARSGVEALELLLKHDFALALVDVQMPEMNGFELAELMRGMERTRNIPIIFVTAGLRDYDRLFKGYESGAVDFLFKPLDTHIVKSKIRVFKELYEQKIKLRTQEELFRSTFENAAVGLAHVSLEGQWLRANQRFCDMLGYTHRELVAVSVSGVSHPDDYARFTEMAESVRLGSLTSGRGEHRFIRSNGDILWGLMQVSLVRTLAGEPDYYIVSAADITHRMTVEGELIEARKKAERASAAKSQFLANMSHEIRTPMNAILGFSDIMREKLPDGDPLSAYAERIRANGDLLLRLIDDVLDFSKLESGHMQIERNEVNVREIINETIHSLRSLADKKGIALRFITGATAPEQIIGDALRIRQILNNLIGNAIKFTPENGWIEVRTSLRFPSLGGSRGVLSLEIEDNGIGIAPENQAGIFRPFVQADGSITRRFGGTGLGLSLSKELAKALGGDLSLTRSTPGKGTLFTLSLPPGRGSSFVPGERVLHAVKPELGPDASALQGLRVLVVDDSPDNVDLITLYLSKYKMALTIAQNGLEAVQQATLRDFDIVLMDMQMPVLDGLQATRILRERGIKTPIIALTAHAFHEEAERTRAAGCDEHVTKPVSRQSLVEAILRQLTGKVKITLHNSKAKQES